MTQADDLKKIAYKCRTRQEALDFCGDYPWTTNKCYTESDTNVTYIFYMQDDSQLKIDEENFIYTNDDLECEKVNEWENE